MLYILKKIIKYLVSFFIITSFFITDISSANEVIILNDETDKISMGKKLLIFQDDKRIHFSDILKKDFKKSNKEVPYYGFSDSVFWVKFDLKNESKKNNFWIIDFSYPLMDHVTFYFQKTKGEYEEIKTGYRHLFKTRQLNHRHFIFPFQINHKEEKTVYMRFENKDRMEIPITIWNIESFYDADHDEQYVMGIYFGILFFMFLFNLLFYFSVRDKTYLYYVAFLFSFAFFQLTQNGFTYEYFTPQFLESFTHIIPFSISMLLISLLLFSGSFMSCDIRYPWLCKSIKAIILLNTVSLIVSFFIQYHIAIIIQLVFSFIVILVVVFGGIISMIDRYRPAFFFMIATSGMLVGGFIYALKVAGIFPSNFIGNYALQIGSVFQFLLLSFGLGDKVNMLRIEKEEARQKVILTEERFNVLVDNSDDVVFTLDEYWNFMTANKAVKKHFRIEPEKLQGMNILDIIFQDIKSDYVSRYLIQEKLEYFSKNKEPISIRIPFKSPIISEPIEMNVHLEYIDIEGKNEILGKATHLKEDALLRYFKTESQCYEMGNYFTAADEVTHRLTSNIAKYAKQKNIAMIRIALREIIINAIEHGNLEIPYDEKTKAQLEDRYFEYIAEKQHDRSYAGRKVRIDYSIDSTMVKYTITDEGKGFDFHKFMQKNSFQPDEEVLPHGRGIEIAKSVFDEIYFEEPGNQVHLVKYYKNF